MAHPRFKSGNFTTNFIAEEYPEGYAPLAPEGELLDRFCAVAAYVHGRYADRANQSGYPGAPGTPEQAQDWQVQIGGEMNAAMVTYRDGGADVRVHEHSIVLDTDWTLGSPVFAARFNGEATTFQIDRLGVAYRVTHRGVEADMRVLTPRAATLAILMPEKEPPDLSKFVLSPMPGLLVSLAVEEGVEVRSGEEVAVVEAMKMENVLRAGADGVVKTIHAKPGDSLSVDQAIVEFE